MGYCLHPFRPCAFENRSGFQKGSRTVSILRAGGGHIKNLYLRDNKKRNILLVAEQDRQIDLKTLHTKLETGRLSFGSAERLMDNLGVRPGAVTPLSMINGVEAGVQLFVDSGLKSCKQIYVHPLVNDRTLGITMEGLQQFFDKIKVKPVWVDLE